jgi:uncharacterized membrane protein YjgN (DUF898 family)
MPQGTTRRPLYSSPQALFHMYLISPLKRIVFKGKGGDLFAVLLVNWLLTMITIGLYYPWAKARQLGWHYANTEMDGHPFHFHGTGDEMFKGFIKAVALLAFIYGTFFLLTAYLHMPVIGFLFFAAAFLCLLPMAIHGTYRYRSSRSSWRGIHFGYHGRLDELFKLCLRDGFFTLITVGIYGSWFVMNLRNYILGHVRYGSSRFRYKGVGLEYFIMNLKGYFLTLITLGIYGFWWQRDIFNYYVDNLSWDFNDGKRIQFKSTATGGGFFRLLAGNILLIIFTLGIGFAWAEVRTMRFVLNHVELHGDADLNAVVQTEAEHKDAMADDLGDMLDIGLII